MDEFKVNIKWLIKFYKPFKNRLIRIAIQSIFSAALTALIPYTLIMVIDGINNNLSTGFIFKSVIILLILGILNFIFSVTNTNLRALTNIELEYHFRQSGFAKIIKHDRIFYEKFKLGDIVTRLTNDVEQRLSRFSCSGVFRAWESCLKLIFCMGAMFYINPLLAVVAIIPLPVQIIIYKLTTGLLERRFKALQKVISEVNDAIQTCFSGIKIVQSYIAEERQIIKFERIAARRAAEEINAEKARMIVHSIYEYFWQISQILVLLTGGWMVIKGELTVGQFVAFDYYIAHLVWPMFDISGLLVDYRRAEVSIKRLREMEEFNTNLPCPEEPQIPEHITGRVIFKNVTFRRDGKTILDNISFDSKGKKIMAIVGEVGSGKSTILSLINRFYDPAEGEIMIDNVPVKKWDLKSLRENIGYVTQEPLLFTDTVKNNITFGREKIDENTILSSSEIACLTDEVKSFSEGFDTKIGLRGMNVSGGQKQRISIARAVAGGPEILLLDDATAHLDAETERDLWDHMYKMLPDMKIFVVSHRTVTLEKADHILVIKDGKIAEEGKHEYLLSKKGEYYKIYSRTILETIN